MRENFEYFEDTKQMAYNGVILPSVGSIISPVSATYYTDDIPEEWIEIAKYRGKVIHEAIEKFLETGVLEIADEQYRGYLDAFINWYYKVKPKVIAVEKVLYTSKYWGIADLIVEIMGYVYIIDVKNSAKLIKELTELQLTGYKNGALEEDLKITGIMGLHLKKDGKYDTHLLQSREDQFNDLVEGYYERKN